MVLGVSYSVLGPDFIIVLSISDIFYPRVLPPSPLDGSGYTIILGQVIPMQSHRSPWVARGIRGNAGMFGARKGKPRGKRLLTEPMKRVFNIKRKKSPEPPQQPNSTGTPADIPTGSHHIREELAVVPDGK